MAKYAVLQNFYASKAWRVFRAAFILDSMNQSPDKGLHCRDCNRIIANEKEAEIDHIIELTPENVKDACISLNPENTRILCHDCHNKRHKRFGHNKKKVYVVFGCPCSGKTTYVKRYKERNDIIVCIDSIYAALSGVHDHNNPDSLFSNVMAVYNGLLDQVKTRYGKWSTAWVIGGFPDKYKREKIVNDLGAELIFCECSKEEALSRVFMDEHRRHIAAEYTGYIEKWFDSFTE